MLDGINLVCHGLDPSIWYDAPELQSVYGFPLGVIEHTWEVLKQPRKAKYKSLTFTVSPSSGGGVRCYIDGSIHKYKNNGLHNYDGFTMADIQAVVLDLQTRFGIDPARTYLHGLEIGINIPMESHKQVVRSIRAAIVQKNKPYTDLFPRSNVVGKLAARDAYEVKIYDKGRASNKEQPILRIEVRVLKMRYLSGYGLETLADLTSPKKVNALIGVLKDALGHTVFIDPYAQKDQLNQREVLLLETFRQPEKWVKLDFEQRRTKREQIERILKKCNAFNVRNDLERLILREWEILLNVDFEAEKQPMFAPIFEAKEAVAKPMFAPLEYVDANMGFTLCDEQQEKQGFLPVPKRVCCSCGSDISNQRKQSRFCSEKYKGGIAKKCRNKDSNQRKTKRLQIMSAKNKNLYVRITYHAANDVGQQFTDTLHSSEIAVSREWLDRVVRVDVLSQTPETLTDSPARELLKTFSNANYPPIDTGFQTFTPLD